MRIFGENVCGPLLHETPFGNRKSGQRTQNFLLHSLSCRRETESESISKSVRYAKRRHSGEPVLVQTGYSVLSERARAQQGHFVCFEKKFLTEKKIESQVGQVFKIAKCLAVKWILT